MAVLKFNITPDGYEAVTQSRVSPGALLNQTLQSSAPQIIDYLTRYHSQHGDTCHIDGFEVTDASLQNDQKSGTVVISYVVRYVYACADITREAKDHETRRFDIDEESLLLHMPEYEVRSTQDEF